MSKFILSLGDTHGIEVGDLVQVARDALADGRLTFGEIVQLGGLLASKVNRFVGLSGQQKQKIVIGVIDVACKQLLSEKYGHLSEEQYEQYRAKLESAQEFAKTTLPSVLDLAVSAAKGRLDLGTVKRTCCSLVSLLRRYKSDRQVPLEPTKAIVLEVPQEATKETTVVQPVEEKSAPVPEEEKKAEEDRPANTVVESNPQEAA